MARLEATALLCLSTLAAIGCSGAPMAVGPGSEASAVSPAGEACDRARATESAAALVRRLQGDGIVLYAAADFPDPDGLSSALRQAVSPDARVEPFLMSTGELSGPGGTRPALLDGRVPRALDDYAPFAVEGSISPLVAEVGGGAPFAVAVGRGLARALGVRVGDVVPIASRDIYDAPSGVTARVVAILGWPPELETYDEGHVLMSLPAARATLFRAPEGDEITGLTVYTRSPDDLDRVEETLLATPSRPYQLWTFEQLHRGLLDEVEALRRACPAVRPTGR